MNLTRVNELTVEDWLKRGYRRFELSGKNIEINRRADFMVQRKVYDEEGVRYFITVYCYDRKKYPSEYSFNLSEFGFMTTVNFSLGDDKPFFTIEMNAFKTIDEVEEHFDIFWCSLGKPYYERN